MTPPDATPPVNVVSPTTSPTTSLVPPRRAVPHPREYAHVVLRTAQPERLIDWYCAVLGMSVFMRTPGINFLTWDESQDRLAIVRVPPEQAPSAAASSLHHIAFTYDSLAETVGQYRALGEIGIEPYWCINHGVATSYYYRDPDGNSIEMSVNHFDDRDTLNGWLASGDFDRNHIGVTLDPDAFAQRVESGEDEAAILRPHPDHADGLAAELARRKAPAPTA